MRKVEAEIIVTAQRIGAEELEKLRAEFESSKVRFGRRGHWKDQPRCAGGKWRKNG